MQRKILALALVGGLAALSAGPSVAATKKTTKKKAKTTKTVATTAAPTAAAPTTATPTTAAPAAAKSTIKKGGTLVDGRNFTTGDPTTADDIVQDTIERALKFAPQYERGTNLRAWVYQILFSVFVTRYRRCRREKNALRSLASDPCAWTTPSHFASPEAGASLSPTTKGKLDALPETFRAVLTLVDLGELTYREAATELGVPVGTVMSRLHRGRKLLASQLLESQPQLAA